MLRSPIAKRLGVKQNALPERSVNEKFYKSSAWMKLRVMLLRRNPICQRIISGKQCRNASVIGHHLLSPVDSPGLALVPQNIVMLCRSCHPDTQGTPSWIVDVHFVRTVGFGNLY